MISPAGQPATEVARQRRRSALLVEMDGSSGAAGGRLKCHGSSSAAGSLVELDGGSGAASSHVELIGSSCAAVAKEGAAAAPRRAACRGYREAGQR